MKNQQNIPILSQSRIGTVKCVLHALQLVAKSISSRPGGKKGLSHNPTIEDTVITEESVIILALDTQEAENEPEHSGG